MVMIVTRDVLYSRLLQVLVNDELVFRVSDVFKKFESPSFRHETKMYTLNVIGNQGYNFRVQLRKVRAELVVSLS